MLYIIVIALFLLALYGFWETYKYRQSRREARMKEIARRLEQIEARDRKQENGDRPNEGSDQGD